MAILINDHLDLLGKKVRDRVTGFAGVAASVSFDLYGCIQVVINPGLDKDGKLAESHWFDVNRVEVTEVAPVMPVPKYDWTPEAVSRGAFGAAEKPMPRR